MSAPSPLDTLFLPFDNGILDWDKNTLFMGADVHPSLESCEAWQVWKPVVDRLSSQKIKICDGFSKDRTYACVLIHLPKQVQEAKGWIAQGLSVLTEGGLLMVAAANDAGGNRVKGWMEEAGLTDILSESKNKSRVVWVHRPKILKTDILKMWAAEAAPRDHDFGQGLSLQTQPGLFSWDRVDKASALLMDHLPPSLAGHGADLGCGYGYLSYGILKNYPKIKSLVMIEADARALACAVHNVKDVQGDRVVQDLWHDGTKNPSLTQPLDFIVMNPPFHTGKKTDVDLGQAFIRTASTLLKKGGNLSLVANNHLPYEAVCEALFKNVKIVVQQDGFKVIRAIK